MHPVRPPPTMQQQQQNYQPQQQYSYQQHEEMNGRREEIGTRTARPHLYRSNSLEVTSTTSRYNNATAGAGGSGGVGVRQPVVPFRAPIIPPTLAERKEGSGSSDHLNVLSSGSPRAPHGVSVRHHYQDNHQQPHQQQPHQQQEQQQEPQSQVQVNASVDKHPPSPSGGSSSSSGQPRRSAKAQQQPLRRRDGLTSLPVNTNSPPSNLHHVTRIPSSSSSSALLAAVSSSSSFSSSSTGVLAMHSRSAGDDHNLQMDGLDISARHPQQQQYQQQQQQQSFEDKNMSLNRRASLNQHLLPMGNIGASSTQNNNNNNNAVNSPMISVHQSRTSNIGAPLSSVNDVGGGGTAMASGSLPRISVVQPRPTRHNTSLGATFALFDRSNSRDFSNPSSPGGGLGFSYPDTSSYNVDAGGSTIMTTMSISSQEGE